MIPLFDDAGSWPLPSSFDRGGLAEMAIKREPSYVQLVQKSMEEKINAGLEVPNYPQFQDMCEQFLFFLRNEEFCRDNPYQIKEENARILELDFIEDVAKRFYEKDGQKLLVRACVTGALELYLREFGNRIDESLLFLFSESMNAFLKNSILDTKYAKTQAVSIDDPSLCLIDINVEEETVIKAWEKTASGIDCDVQIHLHSPLASNIAALAHGIDVVSAETAGHPEYLDLIDKSLLLQNDKCIRIGITRSDFDRMASEYNEENKTNVFKQKDCCRIIAERETPILIGKRLKRAFKKFGDLITYVGPDCTLKGWGTGEIASLVVKNTRKAIDEFRGEHPMV